MRRAVCSRIPKCMHSASLPSALHCLAQATTGIDPRCSKPPCCMLLHPVQSYLGLSHLVSQRVRIVSCLFVLLCLLCSLRVLFDICGLRITQQWRILVHALLVLLFELCRFCTGLDQVSWQLGAAMVRAEPSTVAPLHPMRSSTPNAATTRSMGDCSAARSGVVDDADASRSSAGYRIAASGGALSTEPSRIASISIFCSSSAKSIAVHTHAFSLPP